MKNLAFIVLILISTAACASKKKVAKTDTNDVAQLSQVLSLSKTACFGECPVFTLKIYNNGLAVLDGKKFLRHIGLYEMMLTSEEMKALIKTCDEGELFALKDDYTERVMDIPTTTLVYNRDGKTKKISGNMKFPVGFKSVVKDCMDLLDDDRWALKKAYNTK